MKVSDVAKELNQIAPAGYAEEWDNVGLLIGDANTPCRRVMTCIDLTDAVLAEARRARAQLVMAYHTVIFKPLASLTPATSPIAWRAVRDGLAIYSVHTAWDVVVGGANDCLADALGMSPERTPLQPRNADGGCKVVVFAPREDIDRISSGAFAAGAGRIGNYSGCGFATDGTGTFFGEAGSSPATGRAGRTERVEELRWEVVCPPARLAEVLAAIRTAHSYETPAIDVYRLADAPPGVGLGRVGKLARPVAMPTMLARIRKACGVKRILLAGRPPKTVRTLAVGCGSCGRLYEQALAARADLYVTGELRHHDALAAERAGLTVACVGHSNSERLSLATLAQRLTDALPGLTISQSRADRDPFDVV